VGSLGLCGLAIHSAALCFVCGYMMMPYTAQWATVHLGLCYLQSLTTQPATAKPTTTTS
jgi:hypothetical protein